MTQQDLIDLLKIKNIFISKSMISKWENRKEEPSRFHDVGAIADIFGVTADYLIGLTDERYDKNPNVKGYKRIPLLGSIAAGVPILAQQNIEDYDYVPGNLHVDFCLRVKGDSMINARIFDGDTVYIRKQPDVENGEVAAVLIDGESATLKRVYKNNGTVILHAENPNYKDMVFAKKDMRQVVIIGKAIRFSSEVR